MCALSSHGHTHTHNKMSLKHSPEKYAIYGFASVCICLLCGVFVEASLLKECTTDAMCTGVNSTCVVEGGYCACDENGYRYWQCDHRNFILRPLSVLQDITLVLWAILLVWLLERTGRPMGRIVELEKKVAELKKIVEESKSS
jgi:hypothetical protein